MRRPAAREPEPRPSRVCLLYSSDMRWWRYSRLAQTVSLILLLWTAADLTNTSLCALENEDIGFDSVGTTATLIDSPSSQAPVPAPPHIDDCFCCSHCVDVKVLSPATLAMPVDLQHMPLVLASPRIFGSPLYHPPLA